MPLAKRTFCGYMDEWCRHLTAKDKKALDLSHMGGMFGVKGMSLDIDFIYSAIDYWNIDTHCFRFFHDEICPLPEEFGAIIGYYSTDLAVMPRINEYYYKDFEHFFDLRGTALKHIVHGNIVDLTEFAHYFYDNPNPDFRVYKRRAFLYCLFNQLLLVSGKDNEGQSIIISVIEQVESGRNPMPLIVGETMLWLDALRKDSRAPLRGSPILLHV